MRTYSKVERQGDGRDSADAPTARAEAADYCTILTHEFLSSNHLCAKTTLCAIDRLSIGNRLTSPEESLLIQFWRR